VGMVRTLFFSLFVTTADGMVANATTTVELQPSFLAPIVVLSPPLSKFNANKKIILTRKVVANSA
jgi:hypothetical protein